MNKRSAGSIEGFYENDDDDEDEEEDEMSIANLANTKKPSNDDGSRGGSSELTASEEEQSWINWFTSARGNDFLCVVDDEYIQDDFNLTGLSKIVPIYEYALDIILDVDVPLETLNEEQQDIIEIAAELLYGLIHARYILTTRGMQQMHEKYLKSEFGICPRVYCEGQSVLPIGLSDNPRDFSVNVFCPKCREIYYPRSSKKANLDGAYFGTTFAHLFLLLHPELIPTPPTMKYTPRIYGFKISKDSDYYKYREEQHNTNTSTSSSTIAGSGGSGGGGTGAIATTTTNTSALISRQPSLLTMDIAVDPTHSSTTTPTPPSISYMNNHLTTTTTTTITPNTTAAGSSNNMDYSPPNPPLSLPSSTSLHNPISNNMNNMSHVMSSENNEMTSTLAGVAGGGGGGGAGSSHMMSTEMNIKDRSDIYVNTQNHLTSASSSYSLLQPPPPLQSSSSSSHTTQQQDIYPRR